MPDTLHWLPVTQRTDYKIALMTYSCVHGTSPAYVNGICRPVASVEGRAMLRSANYWELVEPRTRGKRYGPRSFRVAAPFVWNNLPRHLRNDDINREQFACDLKTFLLHGPIRQRGLWAHLFKRRFINGLTYLLTLCSESYICDWSHITRTDWWLKSIHSADHVAKHRPITHH